MNELSISSAELSTTYGEQIMNSIEEAEISGVYKDQQHTLILGMQVKRMPSPRSGYVNLYPITAFKEIYPMTNQNLR